jgi:hypothetical protein
MATRASTSCSGYAPTDVEEMGTMTQPGLIVDDIVDTRLGSQRGDRRGDCVIDVNDCHHTVGLNT